MASVSEAIVREYFELHGFFVRQQRKHVAPSRREEDEADFFVLNPQARTDGVAVPFVLGAGDLGGVGRAVVVVKGWHTETFSPAVLTNAPEIFRFVEPGNFQTIARAYGGEGPILKILAVPALPQAAEAREQSIQLLRAKGIDAVIPFHTMLADLVAHVEANRNYQKSDLLQLIRILKSYDFLRDPQLELFKAKRRGARRAEAPEG